MKTGVLNQMSGGDVCQVSAMQESASRYPGVLVSLEADLEREFEDRLQESSALAVRVAYGVLRQREDAEDVGPGDQGGSSRCFQEDAQATQVIVHRLA